MIKTFRETAREMRPYFIGIVIIWAIYVLLTLLAPAAHTTNRYGISIAQINLLRITLLIPYLFIWVAALFSVLQYKKYLKLISRSSEFQGFKNIVSGITMLLLQLVVSPYLGLVASYNPNSSEVQRAVTIIRTDFTIVFYLAAFYFFWKGTKLLVNTILKKDVKDKLMYSVVPLLLIPLSIALVWFISHNDFRTFSSDPLIKPTYYLGDVSIFITIVIPYIIIWLLGFLSLINLKYLSKNVEGIIYKKSFDLVSKGLAIIIGLTIGLQFLTQATTYFRNASLSLILLLVYAILFCIGAAYVFFAYGAKSLTKIEKI
jgi:hypothetical protein